MLPLSGLPDSCTQSLFYRPVCLPSSWLAAIISIFNKINNLLNTNPYVIVIFLDYSKAFDTVWHSTLLEKLAQLDIPDHAYNWLVDFYAGHSHCTVYNGQVSTLKSITASITQGSSVGAAAYVVNVGD